MRAPKAVGELKSSTSAERIAIGGEYADDFEDAGGGGCVKVGCVVVDCVEDEYVVVECEDGECVGESAQTPTAQSTLQTRRYRGPSCSESRAPSPSASVFEHTLELVLGCNQSSSSRSAWKASSTLMRGDQNPTARSSHSTRPSHPYRTIERLRRDIERIHPLRPRSQRSRPPVLALTPIPILPSRPEVPLPLP